MSPYCQWTEKRLKWTNLVETPAIMRVIYGLNVHKGYIASDLCCLHFTVPTHHHETMRCKKSTCLPKKLTTTIVGWRDGGCA